MPIFRSASGNVSAAERVETCTEELDLLPIIVSSEKRVQYIAATVMDLNHASDLCVL